MSLELSKKSAAVLALVVTAACTKVEVVDADATFLRDVGLLPSMSLEDYVPFKRTGSSRPSQVVEYDAEEHRVIIAVPTFSDQQVERFDYVVRMDRIDNNRSEAGLRRTLRIAQSKCDLEDVPSREEIDLVQGFTAYFNRNYFFRCPKAGRNTQ